MAFFASLQINFDNEALRKGCFKLRPAANCAHAGVHQPVHHDPVGQTGSKTSPMNTAGASFPKHILPSKNVPTSYTRVSKVGKLRVLGLKGFQGGGEDNSHL